MTNQFQTTNIPQLFNFYGIGPVTTTPQPVSGGLMHKVYKVSTLNQTYAVKILNPSIMKRPGVMENMVNSERIAAAFAMKLPVVAAKQPVVEARRSVVAAINISGSIVVSFQDDFYMIYNWLDGASIFPPAINEDHCHKIGRILGTMHSMNLSLPGITKEHDYAAIFPWNLYLEKAREQEATWITEYAEVLDSLPIWNEQSNAAKQILSKSMVISHRDLDPKNVMWSQGEPYLIDWEAAGYVNPYQELLEVLNYWADDGCGGLEEGRFKALLQSYREYKSTEQVDWNEVLYSGYSGMLGWLDYSLKRALGMESMEAEERKLGAEQVVGTIATLRQFEQQAQMIQEWVI